MFFLAINYFYGYMNRYFIHLAYKGTNYHGWQIQPNADSIQERLQEAFSILHKEQIKITGCGRTDTGVHARNFYAHYDTTVNRIDSPENFIYKINKLIPSDIVVYGIYKMSNKAHSRFDALSRTYKYYISKSKDVFFSEFCWQQNLNLNLDRMNQASKILMDYKDFTSFSKLHTDVKTNICHIQYAKWEQDKNMFIFTIRSDRFLRNMVRAVVGTLIEVGMEKITIDGFCEIIEKKDRSSAGMSVPAYGLFLVDIEYPYEIKGL